MAKRFFWLRFVLAMTLSASLVLSPTSAAFAADDEEDIKDDINKIEKKLKEAEKKKSALEEDLGEITSSLRVTQAVIQRTQSLIVSTESSIDKKEAEVSALEMEVTERRSDLSELVLHLYYSATIPPVEALLSEEDIRKNDEGSEALLSVNDRVDEVLNELETTKSRVETEKASLEEDKEEHERLLRLKDAQRRVLATEQQATKSDLAEQEATIDELEEKLQELRGDLSALTGKSFSAKDIKGAVEYASKETGVPKGVLYGFLKMETNLGANTGQCTYDQVKKDAMSRYYSKNKSKYKNSIALLEKRHTLFKDIVDDLGYSKNKKVSCTPRSYVGQGGAMGVSQFMSDTWRGYEAEIRARTGSKNPDPWDLADGVMALALKVKRAGGTSDSASAIRKASVNYLGAFNANYYSGIVYWSKNYKRLFS